MPPFSTPKKPAGTPASAGRHAGFIRQKPTPLFRALPCISVPFRGSLALPWLITLILLTITLTAHAQTYYNLQHTWAEVDSAVGTVLDSLDTYLDSKANATVSHIRLPQNPGIPILIDLDVDGSPTTTEHGYILAVDGSTVLRLAGYTSNGDDIASISLTVGDTPPEAGYALTVNGPAMATRWDVAGADFAEYFQAEHPNLLPGISVVFTPEGLVRPALAGEIPFGVTSQGAGFVGNTGRPRSQFLTTALGDTILTAVEYVEITWQPHHAPAPLTAWVPVDRLEDIPLGAAREIRLEPKLNPDFGKPYVPHRLNPDYTLIGIIGQMPLRKGQPTSPSWIFIRELDYQTDLWLIK